jgi:hypothetical protein
MVSESQDTIVLVTTAQVLYYAKPVLNLGGTGSNDGARCLLCLAAETSQCWTRPLFLELPYQILST